MNSRSRSGKRPGPILAAAAVLLGMFAARASVAQTINVVPQGALPVRVSSATGRCTPRDFGTAAFTFYNAASQRLVAVAVDWTYTFADGHAIHGFQAVDYLYSLARALQPGDSVRLMSGVPRDRSSASPVTAVTLEIAGVELADGTVLGPDSARMVARLAEARARRARAFRSLLTVYRERGEGGLQSSVNSHGRSDTSVMDGVKRGLRWLEARQGMPAVVERVKRQAAVESPPLK